MQGSHLNLAAGSIPHPQIWVGHDVGKSPWVTMLENSTVDLLPGMGLLPETFVLQPSPAKGMAESKFAP
jgi:hypothetical protein